MEELVTAIPLLPPFLQAVFYILVVVAAVYLVVIDRRIKILRETVEDYKTLVESRDKVIDDNRSQLDEFGRRIDIMVQVILHYLCDKAPKCKNRTCEFLREWDGDAESLQALLKRAQEETTE